MKKIKFFLFYLLPFTFYLLLSPAARAEGEFKTDVAVEYKVQENGITQVNNRIKLENLYTDLYVTSYSLILDHINPGNIRAYDSQDDLKTETEKTGSQTKIVVFFADAVVGKGKVREFNIAYNDSEIATRTGEVWEITIPKLAADSAFATYTLSFSVPVSFGQEAYLSPAPNKKEFNGGRRFYTFAKNSLTQTGITAAYGEFQIFSFNFIYHLENPMIKPGDVDIAVPPDTSLQKVYYTVFQPKPVNLHSDSDGNWLATYTLKARERTDITVKGYVQIFAGPRPFAQPSQPTLASNLKASNYWQITDPAIVNLASQYKTPKEIYDFVSTYLTYDTDRAKPNAARLGAVEALKNPRSAICTEFTDLFIALARAAGIPAREINGFAYTQNPKIQPLSLVSDVLHAWPEYWDRAKNNWVAIDPTWGATTGGVDFFTKLDLRHFTFVIHGLDPQKPYPPGSYKLGPNPQKDVFVNFAQLPEDRLAKAEISYNKSGPLPFRHQKVSVVVKNTGAAAFYNLDVLVSFDGSPQETKKIEVLPPFASFSFDILVPFSFMGRKTPQSVTVSASDAKASFTTAKKEVVIYNLAAILTGALIILVLVLIKLKKDDKHPLFAQKYHNLLIKKDLFKL